MNEFVIKNKMIELCDSIVRNINDNFRNISFNMEQNGHIQIKIILDYITEKEYNYIDDMSAEFEAAQESDVIKKIELTTDINSEPFSHVIYCRED